MTETVNITQHTQQELKQTTAQDPTLKIVTDYVLKGWSDNASDCIVQARPYFNVRDELSYEDQLLFPGNYCVIPQSMRAKIRTKLLTAHTGIQSTIRYARIPVYWPGINAELKDLKYPNVTHATHLSEISPRNPWYDHEIPERPWKKPGCDILTLDDEDYLVTVDYYSDYFE